MKKRFSKSTVTKSLISRMQMASLTQLSRSLTQGLLQVSGQSYLFNFIKFSSAWDITKRWEHIFLNGVLPWRRTWNSVFKATHQHEDGWYSPLPRWSHCWTWKTPQITILFTEISKWKILLSTRTDISN